MKTKVYKFVLASLFLMIATLLTSCEKGLDVQQNFPFEVKVMPVPKSVSQGQIVEIRCQITTPENYVENQYFIRYFQFDGSGNLHIGNAEPLLPNDSYDLPNKIFRLYYLSLSQETEKFSVWINDSFGNEQKIDFEFSNIKDE
ncbi:TraQ conjugal transfer family protein [Capnocytophaga canis]|uniref:TraQ conjugal transfer family protein n=1 Tax=Capnocytophaga canis TaxID=1848903 RepID=UPI0037D4D41D